jgi:hypothetical protein
LRVANWLPNRRNVIVLCWGVNSLIPCWRFSRFYRNLAPNNCKRGAAGEAVLINSLIANAVLSIQIGVEDYRSAQFGRSLSAVRNIYAGVLLLCKEVLDRNSPPDSESVLVKAKIVPVKQTDGTVKLVGKGRATVDRQQIEERFKSLGLALDWKRLTRLGQIRNDVEHYFSQKPETLIKEAAADAFVLIHKLIVHHLEEMPLALLGGATWQALLEANEVLEEERKTCAASFTKVEFRSDVLKRALARCLCLSCGSSLIMQRDPENTDQEEIELLCSACGHVPDKDDVFEAAVIEEMAVENHISIKDTNEAASEGCPECNHETFIVSEGTCALCGFSLVDAKCPICHSSISVHEYNYEANGLCSWCYHVAMKTKDE